MSNGSLQEVDDVSPRGWTLCALTYLVISSSFSSLQWVVDESGGTGTAVNQLFDEGMVKVGTCWL
jgi:hypothetical protein